MRSLVQARFWRELIAGCRFSQCYYFKYYGYDFCYFLRKKKGPNRDRATKKTDEIEALSNLDGLTGLFNRRYFDKKLNEEWRRLSREGLPLSLIMADIDFFKKFNDACGHLKGDDCIRAVADCIKDSIGRVSDVAARYGGEEFAAILPNTSTFGANEIAQKVILNLEQKAILHPDSEITDRVTISLGVATVVPDMAVEPAALIALADEALYASKTSGRNRITSREKCWGRGTSDTVSSTVC